MDLRKYIKNHINNLLSENDNLPWGAEYMSDAPFNQTDAKVRKGETPKSSEYSVVWYGYGSGIAMLRDRSGKLYVFTYESVDNEDFEPYADREVIGYDEDGWPEYADFELSAEAIERYVNDNLDNITVASGKSAYEDGEDLVEIDGELKDYLLDFANNYVRDNKEGLIKVLSPSNSQIDESVVSENKRPNEPFVKVYFRHDFPSNENRLELINTIKDYFGEPLTKSREDRYWSTFVPEMLLDEFLVKARKFNPEPTDITIQANRFKPLTKELQDNDVIKFFDYTVSEQNPPRAEGIIKPGFIQSKMAFLVWGNNYNNSWSKGTWIDKSMIDKYYFYHGDVSVDVKDHPGRTIEPKFAKIIFDDDLFYGPKLGYEKTDDDRFREEELRKLINSYRGKLEFMFGKKTDSDGRWYTLIPREISDDFMQDAYDFGPYEVETERNITLEDKSLNEIRKIVRAVIGNVIK